MTAVSATGVIGKTIGIRVRDLLRHLKGAIVCDNECLASVRTACRGCVITRAVCLIDYMTDICAVLQENKSVYMALEYACEFVAIWGLFESLGT